MQPTCRRGVPLEGGLDPVHDGGASPMTPRADSLVFGVAASSVLLVASCDFRAGSPGAATQTSLKVFLPPAASLPTEIAPTLTGVHFVIEPLPQGCPGAPALDF